MWSYKWEAKFLKMEGMYVWDKNGESAFGVLKTSNDLGDHPVKH